MHAATAPAATGGLRDYRLSNIDLLRGLVIVVMALDHTRDFFMAGTQQDPMTDPGASTAVFFTRWITHFCAPVFVFLAGTSAGLMLARKSPAELSGFLLKRGLWLLAIEATVISAAWTFAPFGSAATNGNVYVIFQVIWAIGASMVVLAGAQRLGERACLVLGAAIVLGHNLLDAGPAAPETAAAWWTALHSQAAFDFGSVILYVAYPLLPWTGVMLLGFGCARWLFGGTPAATSSRLLRVGGALTAAFIAVRLLDVYGDANRWQLQPDWLLTLRDFLNLSKYPPSLQYLLMTLGPAAMLCAVADRLPAALQRVLVNFGRAPFAVYVAHLYLLHGLAVVLAVWQGFDAAQMATDASQFPDGYGLPLPGVYAVWALVVLALYPLARAVSAVKARRRDWWLSYL